MIQLVDERLERYAADCATPPPELLNELRDYTRAHVNMPQMQVGALEGATLKVLARVAGARRIVEVGCFTGYSALMMASALPDDGELITCEIDPENAEIAQRFFDRSPHGHKIRLRLGPAADTLATLEGPFDMAFIDADKGGYVTYFDLILPKMRANGLIVADNTLWSGRVLDPEDQQDEAAKSIVRFNQHVRRLADLDKVMLTVRDGMYLIVT